MKSKSKDTEEKPVVQTVKLEQRLFVRLKTFSARTRRTHQSIIREALVEYLQKMSSAIL